MPILTPKQEAFVHAYLETGSASAAYRRAYNAAKMKPATVNRKAHDLLRNGKVAARIEELQKKAADKAVLDRAWVLSRLMKTARIGLGEEMVKVRVRKPKSTEVEEIEVHWPDLAAANRSLELLGKSDEVRLFMDRHELTGKDGKDLMPEQHSPRDIARAIVDILRTAHLEGN